jgi:hypothetical protein
MQQPAGPCRAAQPAARRRLHSAGRPVRQRSAAVDRHAHDVGIVSEAEVQPITFEEADEKFASTTLDLKDVLPDQAKIFMLYSGPFKKALAGLSRKELYGSERLVSKAFRFACDNAPVPPA